MPYYNGYHRSRIEVLQMNRQQCVELIESLYGFKAGWASNRQTHKDEALRQHQQEWTIPDHYIDYHPDAEDDAVYFKIPTTTETLCIYRNGRRIDILFGNGPSNFIRWVPPMGDTNTHSLAASVSVGECLPSVLADWLDDYHNSDPNAVEIARLLRICEPVA